LAEVSALKMVLLPTFGRPTIPQFRGILVSISFVLYLNMRDASFQEETAGCNLNRSNRLIGHPSGVVAHDKR
jgi:hypothetical protein